MTAGMDGEDMCALHLNIGAVRPQSTKLQLRRSKSGKALWPSVISLRRKTEL